MGMSILPILSLLAWSLVIEYVTALLSCIDENGIPVDHWVVLSQNENYQYYWHNSTDGFVKSLYDTNQTENGNIMRTMSQLYSPSLDMNNVAYALYNDDPPPPYTTASSTYAHAKGVILTDDIQGFWLIHSKPNWPNGRSEGAAGFPDTTYSQSLMCVTMGSAQFDAIAEAQMVNYPFLYDKFISQNLTVALPTLSQWLGGGKSSNENVSNSIQALDGRQYLQFAKSKSWGRDLYDDYVAPTLGTALYVETWRLGAGGRMGSTCNRSQVASSDYWPLPPLNFDVFEVQEVRMPDGATWTGTQDHSKWAISAPVSTGETPTPPVVCVADLNRMCSQENRGGGAVCFFDSSVNASLWVSFYAAIAVTEDCWAYNPCTATSTQCYWCPVGTSTPTSFNTQTPTIPIQMLSDGDVAVVSFSMDNPDSFSLVFLTVAAVGTQVRVTDKAWTGTTLRSYEGILSMTVVRTLEAGAVVSYVDGVTADSRVVWTVLSGTVALSTVGDQLLVFIGDVANPTFLFAFSTTPWSNVTDTLSSTTSVKPNCAALVLSGANNALYNGNTTGAADQLLTDILDSGNWISGANRYAIANNSFSVVSPTFPSSSPSLLPSSSPSSLQSSLPSLSLSTSPSLLPSSSPSSISAPLSSTVGDDSSSTEPGLFSTSNVAIGATVLVLVAVLMGVLVYYQCGKGVPEQVLPNK